MKIKISFMNKNLKFRVWRYCHRDKKHKFYYLNFLKLTEHGADLCLMQEDQDYIDDKVYGQNSADDVTIMQWTGFRDCNDTMIYDGDIVKIGDCYHPISWNNYSNLLNSYSQKDILIAGNLLEALEI